MTITSYSSATPLSQSYAMEVQCWRRARSLGNWFRGQALSLQDVQVGHRNAAQHRSHDAQHALVGPAEEQVGELRAPARVLGRRAVDGALVMPRVVLDRRRREHV